MTASPLVSVIIPTFNYKNIEKLLEHFNHSSVRLTDFFENDRDVKLIKIEDNLQKEELKIFPLPVK